MSRGFSQTAAGCIHHSKFSVKDIERLEKRVAALKESHDFDDANHVYIEAAAQLADEARSHKSMILEALGKEYAGTPKAKLKTDTPALPKFDNVPELADALAKENQLPQAVADAYMQSAVLGRSHTAIAADLGVGKATVGDWVRKMAPLVDAASPTRLERGAETRQPEPAVATPATEETKAVEDAAPDQRAAPDEEGVDEGIEALDSNIEMLDTGDLADEDNQYQGQGDDSSTDTDSFINISDSPNGKGKTSADNNIAAGRNAQLAKSWAKLSDTLPVDQQVAWKDLGSAQQDAFDAESGRSPARAAKAHATLTALANDGTRYSTDKDQSRRPGPNSQASALGQVRSTASGLHKTVGKFDSLAGAVRDTVRLDGEDVTLLPVRLGATAPVAAAAAELSSHPVAGPLFTMTLGRVDRVMVYTVDSEQRADNGPSNAAAFYNASMDLVAVNGEGSMQDAPTDREAQAEVASALAHELTHAADDHANQDHGTGGRYVSTSAQSRSAVMLSVEPDGRMTYTPSPMMQEVGTFLEAAVEDAAFATSPLRALTYPFEDLFIARAELGSTPPAQRFERFLKNEVKLALAERLAQNEMMPVLVQLRLSHPELLRETLPLAHAAADKLVNAKSTLDVYNALVEDRYAKSVERNEARPAGRQGSEGAQGNASYSRAVPQSPGVLPQKSATGGGVREEVRLLAEANPDAGAVGAPRVQRQAGARAQDGQPEGGGGAAKPEVNRQRHDSGLNLPALAGNGPGGIKAYARSITAEGGLLPKLYRSMPGLLGALSTEQLADRFAEHPLVKKFSDAMQRMGGLSNHLIGEANVVIRDWAKANKEAGKAKTDAFGQMLLDSTTLGMWPNKDFTDPAHAYLKPALKADATQAERDAYNVTVQPLRIKHQALAAAWSHTGAAHQELFERILKTNRDNFARHVAADRKSIIESYYPGLTDKSAPVKALIDRAADISAKKDRAAFLAENGVTETAADRFRDLWESIDSHRSDYDNKLPGPYFPKSRFGDHIVSYKSPEYTKAEAEFEAARQALQELKTGAMQAERSNADAEVSVTRRKLARATSESAIARHTEDLADAVARQAELGKDVTAAKETLQKRTDTLNDFKANDSHYAVEFHENRQVAVQRVAQLEAFFGGDGTSVTRTTRDEYLLRADGTTPAYMTRISDHLAGSMTGVQADEIRKAVREMHIQHLPGSSALKNQLKRKNVPGIKADEALRSFSAKAVKDGYAISRKTYMGELHEHMAGLRYQEGNEDAKILGNELAKRMALNAGGQSPSALISGLTNYTYFAQLGMSPGFMLQQATQMWINTAPMMAARHGVGTTTAALAKGTVDAGKLLKVSFDNSKSKMSFQVDIPAGVAAGLLTEPEGVMLREMFDRGRIDIASSHDAGIAAAGREAGILAHAAVMSNWPVQQLEVVNRIATALAGFRAELKKGVGAGIDMDKARSVAEGYADKLVSETHMNYASENRARFIHPNSWGGWGRIMFQFRAYQQGMVFLTLKNVIDGVRGDREALKAAGYMAGVQFGTGGLAAMPMTATMIAVGHLLYAAFGDDDEDRDLKESMFQGIKSVGGEALAKLITKGVPAVLGVDLSEKLGAGHIFDPAPFVRNQKDGRDMTAAYFMALVGGAAGGQVANAAEALHQAGQGEFAKAAMLSLPRTAADLLKAEEFQRVGMKDTRGNTILNPEEVSSAASVIKALGMNPTELGRMQDERAAFFTARAARNDARAKLLQDYARAKIAGEDTQDIVERIDGFNERHTDSRIAKGALPVAVQKRREQERNLVNGVPVGKRDRQLYADVLGE